MSVNYKGTLTGSGQLIGNYGVINVSWADVVTDKITINQDGSYTGTSTQVETLTYVFNGTAQTSTETIITSLSGSINQPFETTQSFNGVLITYSSSFAANGAEIVTKPTAIPVSYQGFSGPITIGGTLLLQHDIHFDVHLNGNGFGTVTVTDNGAPMPVRVDKGDSTECAYDNLMPVRAGTYKLTFQTSDFLFSNTPWGTGIQLKLGSDPGDCKGCIVVGNGVVDGIASDNFWNGLIQQISAYQVSGTLESITSTVSGVTSQPKLVIKPDQSTINQGASDTITFEIDSKGTTTVPLDKDLNIYFKVKSSVPGSNDFTVTDLAGNLIKHGTGAYASDYVVTIMGDHAIPPTGMGANDFSVVIHTNGTATETLKIKIIHYDEITYTTLHGVKVYSPATQPLTTGTVVEKVNVIGSSPAAVAPQNSSVVVAPNDTLTAGLNHETFVFPSLFGQVTIKHFNAQADIIEFSSSEFSNFAALKNHIEQIGGNTVITCDANDVITLIGVHEANLHASNFHFS